MNSREEILEKDFCNAMDAVGTIKQGLSFAKEHKLPTIGRWETQLMEQMKRCTKARMALEVERARGFAKVDRIRKCLMAFPYSDSVFVKVSDGHSSAYCRITKINASPNPDESGCDVQIEAEVIK